MLRNGIHVEATASAVRAIQTEGTVTYTAMEPFVGAIGGSTFILHPGQTVLITPALASSLLALGARLTLVP